MGSSKWPGPGWWPWLAANKIMSAKSGRIVLYDTTLRDGAAREGLTLSVGDKIHIAHRLARLGVSYIEGGYAGSNPKEMEFFRRMAEKPLRRSSKLVAFGSTRYKKSSVKEDRGLAALLAAGTDAVCVFGKASDFQVRVALGTSLKENLAMIRDSVTYLIDQGREVFFDAEHFFDGYKLNPDYTKKVLRTAGEAGASWLVLCDTNGGALPGEINGIVQGLINEGFSNLGIHAHNDINCADAVSLAAVEAGCWMVHGTINGYGERTGNADLCSIIPTLELRMDRRCLPKGNLAQLTEVSHFVSETANLRHNPFQPYVGRSAFSHKGGAHGSAVRKNSSTYEHIAPEMVGNAHHLVVSEIAGRSMIAEQAERLGIEFSPAQLTHLITRIKDLEYRGYKYEAADASLDLLLLEEAGKRHRFFELESYHLHLLRLGGASDKQGILDATIKIKVGEKRYLTAAEGNGPVNALDRALRKSLLPLFPKLEKVRLLDYKVRVLEGSDGTQAVTRVLIETGDGIHSWGTIGVNENIIKASWDALYDSIEYGLMRLYKKFPQ